MKRLLIALTLATVTSQVTADDIASKMNSNCAELMFDQLSADSTDVAVGTLVIKSLFVVNAQATSAFFDWTETLDEKAGDALQEQVGGSWAETCYKPGATLYDAAKAGLLEMRELFQLYTEV